MNTEKAVARISDVIRRKHPASPRSGVTAPGSGEIATTSKSSLLICRVNKNWNGFTQKDVTASAQNQAFN